MTEKHQDPYLQIYEFGITYKNICNHVMFYKFLQ